MKRFWTGFWFLTTIIWFPTAIFAAPTVMFSEEPTPSQTPNDNADEPQIEFYTQDDPEAEEIKFDKPKLHDFWPKNTAYLFVRNKPIADSVADFCKMQGIDAVLSERLKDNKQRVNRSFEKMFPTHIWDQLAKAYGLSCAVRLRIERNSNANFQNPPAANRSAARRDRYDGILRFQHAHSSDARRRHSHRQRHTENDRTADKHHRKHLFI